MDGLTEGAENLSKDHQWAMQKVNEYFYREKFHLSYEEFLNEPLDSFLTNSQIISIIERKQAEAARKAERKANG